ncbi:TonB-dependent receptor [Henriciella aquimarina]|uniref:TonB-dependent receptor n=1 Tax=Henriciella aquimarina TaxID=545261 RepID=UPI001301A68E|nr:TonB-dependent receptor [Henriciella aquimarina]
MRFAPSTKKRSLAFKASLCAGAGLSAVLASAPVATAQAQDEEGAETQRRLNAVVVEATRREGVTVQDVPVSVTAFDGALLEDTGVARLNDIEQIAPSVQIAQTESAASGTSIAIRGIGTGSNNPGFEPAVGVVIDGVYRTRTGIALSELPELSSIEVLRGPQGTLFGRNTSAGVVSINTAKPQWDPEASLGAGFGNYGMYSAEAMVTGPVAENVAARLDVKHRSRDGYIDDVNSDREFNNLDRFLMRGQLLFEKDDASLRVIGDFGKTNEDCCVGVNLVQGPTAPAVIGGAAMDGLIGFADAEPDDYEVAISPNRPVSDNVEEWGISAEYKNRFGTMNFTSITSYRDWQAMRDQDIDFSGIDRAYRDGTEITDEVFTQEVRLQDNFANIDWLVGAFYMHEELGYTDTIRTGTQANEYTDLIAAGATGGQLFGSLPGVPPLLGYIDPTTGAPTSPTAPGAAPFYLPQLFDGAGQNNDVYDTTTDALALFTHNEIALTDKLTATIGARLNYEEKEIEYDLDGSTPPCNFFVNSPAGSAVIQQLIANGAQSLILLSCNPAVNTEYNGADSDSFDDTVLTGTAKLAYKFTPDFMSYVSYSRGFKSGGYNLDRSGFDSVLFGGDGAQPEDLQFDSETVDSYELGWKASFDSIAATLNGAIFYQDVKDFQENFFTGTNFRVLNSDVESYGLELDGSIQPVEGLTLQGGYAYTKVERQNDVITPRGDGTDQLLAPSGVQLAYMPEHVGTLAGTYLFPITPELGGIVHLNARYNSEHATSEATRGIADNDAYVLFGGRVGIQSADGRWEVSVFGENITDEYYNMASFAVPEQTGTIAVYPGIPAMYGAEFKVNF